MSRSLFLGCGLFVYALPAFARDTATDRLIEMSMIFGPMFLLIGAVFFLTDTKRRK